MLPKPSILKVPDASSAVSGNLKGCNSGYTTSGGGCTSGYSCNPVSGGNCVDSDYNPGCNLGLGIIAGGAGGAVGGIVVGIIIS